MGDEEWGLGFWVKMLFSRPLPINASVFTRKALPIPPPFTTPIQKGGNSMKHLGFILVLVCTLSNGWAEEVADCNTVDACRAQINQIEQRIAYLIEGEVERQYTSSGRLFIRDHSFPQLGQAWRDESGLVWGQLSHYQTTQRGAEIYCQDLDARLPTAAELRRLGTYLTTTRGFQPEIIAGIEGSAWSSTLVDLNFAKFWEKGIVGQIQRYAPHNFLCVIQK